MTAPEEEPTGPVVRDKRRIDPETGEVRASDDAANAAEGDGNVPSVEDQATAALATELQRQLEERTGDLQRLKAEFDNYRRRVERDRQATAEAALGGVLVALFPVLDDIGRAREHGELDGGFKSVAESLEAATSKLGLVPFGDAGDPFDPQIHEALTHAYGDNVTEPTCAQIYQPGYRLGERVLRPARVGVVEPDTLVEPAEATDDDASEA